MADPHARVSVTFDKRSVAHLQRSLERTAEISTLAFAQKRLEKLLVRRHKARFLHAGTHENAQKDPDGLPWKALSPTTVRRKGRGKPILVDKGNLKDSIKIVRTNLRSVVAVSSSTGARALIGVDKDSSAGRYARIHQTGGQQGTSYTPRRRFIGVGPGEVKAVDRLLNRIAKEQLEG